MRDWNSFDQFSFSLTISVKDVSAMKKSRAQTIHVQKTKLSMLSSLEKATEGL